MRRTEWLVRAALVFCLLYGLVAVQEGTHERFPFFSWDLFARVPNPHGQDFSVRFVEAQGVRAALPVYFEDANLQTSGREVQGYIALQELGKALVRGNKAGADKLRRSFETTYLGVVRHARYEVVKRTYDLRTRIDCSRCFTTETVLAEYTVG